MKLVFAAALIFNALSAFAGDACQAQIPWSLMVATQKGFREFRLPLASDSPPEAIEWNVREGGTGCLGVASADFDGDGKKDYLLGLTALSGSGAVVVAALARHNNWRLHKLAAWPDGRIRLYVATDKPGIYKRSEVLDGPLEKGEVTPLICPHFVAVFGAIESSGVAYCFNRGRWQHVWISD